MLVRRPLLTRIFPFLTQSRIRNPVERALVYPALGTVIGGWLGVIAIALDWDRPWQVRVAAETSCISLTYA